MRLPSSMHAASDVVLTQGSRAACQGRFPCQLDTLRAGSRSATGPPAWLACAAKTSKSCSCSFWQQQTLCSAQPGSPQSLTCCSVLSWLMRSEVSARLEHWGMRARLLLHLRGMPCMVALLRDIAQSAMRMRQRECDSAQSIHSGGKDTFNMQA